MNVLVWIGFLGLILGMLALDLGVFHRRAHVPSMRESMTWSAVWIALAVLFTIPVYYLYQHNWVGAGLAFPEAIDGRSAALVYFTGYLLEKSLSLDNIFVMALIFRHFGVPLAYQHRVLFWGVLGALAFRGVMIGAGVTLVSRFQWTTYLLGGLLLVTAARMLLVKHDELEPERNVLVRMARKVFPVSSRFDGERFFTRVDGRLAVTPLLLVLLLVESTDLIFAVDSIPAILAVTDEAFLVYTSNVFAILGLRSLYFALAPSLGMFRYLNASLVVVIAFVGVKMMLAHHHPIPLPVSLAVIGGVLTVGVVGSILAARLEFLLARGGLRRQSASRRGPR